MCSAMARWSATTVVSGGSASSGGGDVVDADDGEVVGGGVAEPPKTGEDSECRLVVVGTDSRHGWCHGPPAGHRVRGGRRVRPNGPYVGIVQSEFGAPLAGATYDLLVARRSFSNML
jgi:hypothetical protein